MSKKIYLLLVLSCSLCLAPGVAPAQEAAQPGAMTLQDAVHRALERSPDVALAEARVVRAGEALREARAGSLPQVSMGTGLAYNNGFPLSIEGSAPSAFQIGLSQPLFSKKVRNIIREAEKGAEAGRDNVESARNDLAARVALAYSELHHAAKLVSFWVERLEIAEMEENRTADLLSAGRVRPLDLSLARVSAAAARHRLLQARERADTAESELKILTGQPESSRIATSDPVLSSDLLGAPAEAVYQKVLSSHPEIRQAEANLKAREFRIEAEKGGSYPRLDLVSQYALFTRFNNYQDYFNRFTRNNFLIGMSIQVPVFDGALTRSRVAQSLQEAAEARLKLEQLRSGLRLTLERTASNLLVARSAVDLALREREVAAENLRISQSLLEGGRISPGDAAVVDARRNEKEIDLIEAQRLLVRSQIDLLHAAGALASLF